MRRLQGVVDALALVLLALAAVPWCLVAPDSWERLLDRLSRHVLFSRTFPVPPDEP